MWAICSRCRSVSAASARWELTSMPIPTRCGSPATSTGTMRKKCRDVRPSLRARSNSTSCPPCAKAMARASFKISFSASTQKSSALICKVSVFEYPVTRSCWEFHRTMLPSADCRYSMPGALSKMASVSFLSPSSSRSRILRSSASFAERSMSSLSSIPITTRIPAKNKLATIGMSMNPQRANII